VTFGTKSASHRTGKFTCDQDFQVFSLSSSASYWPSRLCFHGALACFCSLFLRAPGAGVCESVFSVPRGTFRSQRNGTLRSGMLLRSRHARRLKLQWPQNAGRFRLRLLYEAWHFGQWVTGCLGRMRLVPQSHFVVRGSPVFLIGSTL
jgi:hypothetical protein